MLLSARQVRYEIAAGELVALPHPLGAPTRAIGLTMRRDWRPTAAQRELIDAIREVTRERGPGSARRSSAPVARERREARRPSAGRRTG